MEVRRHHGENEVGEERFMVTKILKHFVILMGTKIAFSSQPLATLNVIKVQLLDRAVFYVVIVSWPFIRENSMY